MSPEYFVYKVGDTVKHISIESSFYGKTGEVTAVNGETVYVKHSKRSQVWTLARHLELLKREI